MPSISVHLLAASRLLDIYPAAAPPCFSVGDRQAFFAGSIAPDSVSDREPKDLMHLRVYPNRAKALENLYKTHRKLYQNDSFAAGCFFHLYTDFLWDNTALASYKRDYTGGGENGWFLPYRAEIGVLSALLYRTNPAVSLAYDDFMASFSVDSKPFLPDLGLDLAAVTAFFERNHRWHRESVLGPPAYFSCDYAADFAENTAKLFVERLSLQGFSE